LRRAWQGSGKDLIQPVLDNQLKAASPLVLPPEVRDCACALPVGALARCLSPLSCWRGRVCTDCQQEARNVQKVVVAAGGRAA